MSNDAGTTAVAELNESLKHLSDEIGDLKEGQKQLDDKIKTVKPAPDSDIEVM